MVAVGNVALGVGGDGELLLLRVGDPDWLGEIVTKGEFDWVGPNPDSVAACVLVGCVGVGQEPDGELVRVRERDVEIDVVFDMEGLTDLLLRGVGESVRVGNGGDVSCLDNVTVWSVVILTVPEVLLTDDDPDCVGRDRVEVLVNSVLRVCDG
jgi:hypothetical protein